FNIKADLSPDARTIHVSAAVEDILGYQPFEVLYRPIWDFFHADELSQARIIHSRSIRHDKAAGLNYFRIRHKNGEWVACECIFTILCDVLVASTSIYQRGAVSQMRAANAPVLRHMFACSSNDPRYSLLSCMSSKFKPSTSSHEPRAALVLNRFTRSATVMQATPGVVDVLGVSPTSIVSTSFYGCIEECCRPRAIECLENAKTNDSIAYLRFWLRNPIDHNYMDPYPESSRRYTDADTNINHHYPLPSPSPSASESESEPESSFDRSTSSFSLQRPITPCSNSLTTPTELEAIIFCSSDGLVVTLRRARPPIPGSMDRSGCPGLSLPMPTRPPSGEKSNYAIGSSGSPEPESIRTTMHK
ncbi:hypothetical protein FQN49_007975, partial [Arthroderma sp. PD_2]